MEPAEPDNWLMGRPRQLIFLTGFDPTNKKSHNTLYEAFSSRSALSLPLNLRLVRGELDLPGKREHSREKGILRLDWPTKYLDRVPALIVLFLDLDWDHSSWIEKKTEAESKCASIRASCRQGSRLAVVLLQERSAPTSPDDPLATDRAHQLCDACQLSAKQLFVVPMLCNDLQGYVNKLETAFHELSQGFYQQKLKSIRARSIPNNTPSLVVRQLFKLAFLSELRQDTHTALRNYRLAYEQCKESYDHWEDQNIFEWRSVVGLLNYKWCELCFLHSTAVEAINQMRKHQGAFFNMKCGSYPTPQLASIEHQLWKAKQIFLGQRPWRVGCDGLAAEEVERAAVVALVHRLIVNHTGVIELLSAAMTQYRRYGCSRMQLKVMNEMANVYSSSGEIPKALQLWCLAVKEGLPPVLRENVLQRILWASYNTAAIKDYIWCALQVANKRPEIAQSLTALFNGMIPGAPYETEPTPELEQIENLWRKALSEEREYVISTQKINTCLDIEVSFLKYDLVELGEKIPVYIKLTSTALASLNFTKTSIYFDLMGTPLRTVDGKNELICTLPNIVLHPETSVSYICYLDLSEAAPHTSEIIGISKVLTEVQKSDEKLKVLIHHELNFSRRKKPSRGAPVVKFSQRLGSIEADGDLRASCLVGEVAQIMINLKNNTNRPASHLHLEYKRKEQSSTAASAVLFVDDANELRSEVIVNIPCPSTVEVGQTISVPIRFAAQLVGDMDISLEASHIVPGEKEKRVSKLKLVVTAREPFTVTSQILTMNGVPVKSLLNHNEHVLKADIVSNANIIISRVEWLLADVVKSVHADEQNSDETLEEQLCEGDVVCYCKAVTVESHEENVETPLGRVAIEWKRDGGASAARSLVALCRLPVLGCPVVVSAKVENAPAIVRQPIRIHYMMTNTTTEVLELTAIFELTENYMFCGDKKPRAKQLTMTTSEA